MQNPRYGVGIDILAVVSKGFFLFEVMSILFEVMSKEVPENI